MSGYCLLIPTVSIHTHTLVGIISVVVVQKIQIWHSQWSFEPSHMWHGEEKEDMHAVSMLRSLGVRWWNKLLPDQETHLMTMVYQHAQMKLRKNLSAVKNHSNDETNITIRSTNTFRFNDNGHRCAQRSFRNYSIISAVKNRWQNGTGRLPEFRTLNLTITQDNLKVKVMSKVAIPK